MEIIQPIYTRNHKQHSNADTSDLMKNEHV